MAEKSQKTVDTLLHTLHNHLDKTDIIDATLLIKQTSVSLPAPSTRLQQKPHYRNQTVILPELKINMLM